MDGEIMRNVLCTWTRSGLSRRIRRATSSRVTLYFRIAATVNDDRMAMAFEQFYLLLKNHVFTAPLLVRVVDENYLHGRACEPCRACPYLKCLDSRHHRSIESPPQLQYFSFKS